MTVVELKEEEQLKYHLFVLAIEPFSPTHLYSSFEKCKEVSVLPQLAELLFSPQMMRAPEFQNPNLFIKERELLEAGDSDTTWHNNSLQLQLSWDSINIDAKYNIGKSIYDFLRPHILLDYFTNCGFIIVVKNPYTIIQDIITSVPELETELEDVAYHVLHSLIIQRKNNYLLGKNITFTYEDMCNKPEWVESKIKEIYGIEDFKLNVGEFTSPEEQINKFTDFQIDIINEVFSKSVDALTYWGYDLVSREEEIGKLS